MSYLDTNCFVQSRHDGHDDVQSTDNRRQEPVSLPTPPLHPLQPQPLLPLQQDKTTPTKASQTDDAMRLPGSGSLIDSKNTLQSHSTVEFVQAAAENASTAMHYTSGPPYGHSSCNDRDSPVWTGFYKQMQGAMLPPSDPVASDSAETSNAMSNSRQPPAANSSLDFNSSPTRDANDNIVACTISPGILTNSNNNEEDQALPVYVQAYLAYDTPSQQFTIICWVGLACAIITVVVVAVFVTLFFTASNEQGSGPAPLRPTLAPSVPMTFSPTATPTTDNRATRLTSYINTVKLSTGTLVVPSQGFGDDASVEGAALAWLVYDDPLQLSPSNEANQFRLRQRYALLTLFLQFPDFVAASRSSNDSECNWLFVAGCVVETTPQRPQAYVTKIRSNGATTLPSTLSPDLGLLSNLEHFEVWDNALTGSLPSLLGTAWSNLQYLDVSFNALTGSLSSSLGTNWTNLNIFDVSDNDLTGSLPASLGITWSNLESFKVSGNNLMGSLPSSLGIMWSNLQLWKVSDNAFTGSLPSSLGTQWTNLESFSANGNDLSANLPSLLGTSWTHLLFFDVEDNVLVGSLPPSLGSTWTNLTYFEVSDNALTGSLPPSLGAAWVNLTYFDVSDNALTGIIPRLANVWNNVEYTSFANNSFMGSMPNEFCRTYLDADCDEVSCSCCTDCCDDAIAECGFV